ncbi:hypothetical protein TNCV_187081 [Trichonephila clavipes]|nr:hypothetical protein TNCV_187081 [Trichonephila clavipes]
MKTKAYCACLSLPDLRRWVQMFRSSGQSDAKAPRFSSQASLVLIYRPAEEMKRLSRPYPFRDLNPGPVAWKRDTLPLCHWASYT